MSLPDTVWLEEQGDGEIEFSNQQHGSMYVRAFLRTPPPWLPQLLEALGWQGGTIHEALEEVRRLKQTSLLTKANRPHPIEYRAQFEAMAWDSDAVIQHRKLEALASLIKQIPVEFEKLHERGYGTFYVARLFVMPHGKPAPEAEGTPHA